MANIKKNLKEAFSTLVSKPMAPNLTFYLFIHSYYEKKTLLIDSHFSFLFIGTGLYPYYVDKKK